jgi:hypothetical protein
MFGFKSNKNGEKGILKGDVQSWKLKSILKKIKDTIPRH